eukprot:scaffold54024_cov72-Phaeocystis_antarctica.AAC.1
MRCGGFGVLRTAVRRLTVAAGEAGWRRCSNAGRTCEVMGWPPRFGGILEDPRPPLTPRALRFCTARHHHGAGYGGGSGGRGAVFVPFGYSGGARFGSSDRRRLCHGFVAEAHHVEGRVRRRLYGGQRGLCQALGVVAIAVADGPRGRGGHTGHHLLARVLCGAEHLPRRAQRCRAHRLDARTRLGGRLGGRPLAGRSCHPPAHGCGRLVNAAAHAVRYGLSRAGRPLESVGSRLSLGPNLRVRTELRVKVRGGAEGEVRVSVGGSIQAPTVAGVGVGSTATLNLPRAASSPAVPSSAIPCRPPDMKCPVQLMAAAANCAFSDGSCARICSSSLSMARSCSSAASSPSAGARSATYALATAATGGDGPPVAATAATGDTDAVRFKAWNSRKDGGSVATPIMARVDHQQVG